jgi:V-type H+-transporting ATPase subunit C
LKQRTSKTGSPVVPGSAKKVYEEGDSSLYAVTVLKGHYAAGNYVEDAFVPGQFVDYLPALKTAFREKKYVLREFVYDGSKSGGLDGEIEAAKNELKQV